MAAIHSLNSGDPSLPFRPQPQVLKISEPLCQIPIRPTDPAAPLPPSDPATRLTSSHGAGLSPVVSNRTGSRNQADSCHASCASSQIWPSGTRFGHRGPPSRLIPSE
uniref:Uncharacterized protein n=1 Tax=Kalanchoe fedtschenkoi TaxID=63787 RepID=A0A7N1A3Y7_KALFE